MQQQYSSEKHSNRDNNARRPTQVYVGVGCNLGERQQFIASACDALKIHPHCAEIKCSSLYETDPMGPSDQPDYINAVVSLKTSLAPHDLLSTLQTIESEHGRTRDGTRWGPRTLDLDLLLYGDEKIDSATLTVPHPGIAERSFVLLPLLELEPDLVIKGLGTVEQLASECQQFGIRRLN